MLLCSRLQRGNQAEARFQHGRKRGAYEDVRDEGRLIRVGQRGAEDFGSASRYEEDQSPAAAGRPG